MRRIVVGLLMAVGTALSLGLSACDDDQPGPQGDGDDGDAGESSQGGEGGSSGSGGSEGGGEAGAPAVGGTGQGGEPGGGSGGSGTSGNGGTSGSGGNAGTTNGGSTAQGGEGGNDGGSGGGGVPDQLTICLRLMSVVQLTRQTALAYEDALIADCNVNWTTSLYYDPGPPVFDERDIFLNNLVSFNVGLWGCNTTPPTEFSLIYRPAPLTSTDARTLIDIYVETVTGPLSLSPPEIEEMRAILDRLSQPVIDRVSDEYSNPDCAGGAGGGSG